MLNAVDQSTELMGDRIASLAAGIHARTARLLALLAEFDRLEGWAGFVSCAHWLAWRCGLSPAAAREHVRVARALMKLSRVSAAFGRGELSFSKVRAITRIANRETESTLLEWARHGTAAQIERVARGYRRVERVIDPQVSHRQRELTWYRDDDGSVCVRARLSPEDGAAFVRAMEAAEQDIHRDASADEPAAARRADALAAICESFVAREHPDRALIVLHVGDRGLATELGPGTPLHPETARRLACDAGLVRANADMSVGRRTRVIPHAMRRALVARDRTCRFPGCDRRRAEAHHLVHWARGGETATRNLILLCRLHHRLVHEGGFRVEMRTPGAPVFTTPDGRRLEARAARPDTERVEISPGSLGPSQWTRAGVDYDWAIEDLFRIGRRAERIAG